MPPNALPQKAPRPTSIAERFPGTTPKQLQAELQAIAGPKVKVTPDGPYKPSPPSPLRTMCSVPTPRSVRALPRRRHADHPAHVDRRHRRPVLPRRSESRSTGSTASGASVPTTSARTASTSASRSAPSTTMCSTGRMMLRDLARLERLRAPRAPPRRGPAPSPCATPSGPGRRRRSGRSRAPSPYICGRTSTSRPRCRTRRKSRPSSSDTSGTDEAVFADELLVLLHRVARNADDLHAGLLEIGRRAR